MKLGQGSALSLGADTSTDKGGPSGASYIVAIERAKTNNGTLWAGTRRGRIWVTKNADSTTLLQSCRSRTAVAPASTSGRATSNSSG